MTTQRQWICHVALLAAIFATAPGCDNLKRSIDSWVRVFRERQIPARKPDESFPADEYIRLGLPDPGQAWTPDQLNEAADVLQKVADTGCEHLPRYHSKQSAAVFARLASPDNLEPFLDSDVDPQERLTPSIEFVKAQSRITNIYLKAFPSESADDDEVIELVAGQLQSMQVMAAICQEFLDSLDPDDPDTIARKEHAAALQSSLLTAADGALTMLEERRTYRHAALVRHLEHLQDILPQLMPLLSDGGRITIVTHLKRLDHSPASRDLQPGLGKLYSTVLTQR